MDSGNLDELARSLGERRPFRNQRYDGSGNVKASDAYVVGEQVARRLGASSRRSPARLKSLELINFSDQPLRRGLRDKDPDAEVYNFAVAGSTTGKRGSRTADLKDFKIGLKSQTALFAKSTRFVSPEIKPDIIIGAGSNNVLDFLTANESRIRRAVITPGSSGERSLAKKVARKVVADIAESLDSITGLYDQAVILGTGKFSDLPRVREASKGLKRVPLLGGSLSGEFRKFVDRISKEINRRLEDQYNGGDEDDILVINGLDAWKSAKKPEFVDSIHPTSKFNGKLADFVAEQIGSPSGLDSFGL